MNISVSLCLTLCGTLALGAPALPEPPVGEPPQEDVDEARVLADNGYELYQDGSYEKAIAAFRAAYELSGASILLYNTALAYERLGDFDQAIEYIQAYRVFASPEERDKLTEKVESFKRRKLNAELEASEHTGETDAASSSESAAASSRGGSAAASESDAGGPAKPKLFGPGAIAATAVTGAGAVVALGLGVAALQRSSDAEEGCVDNVCSEDSESDLDASRKLALGADIAVGIAAAGAVALVVTLAINGTRRKRAAGGTSAFVVPTRGGAGVGWRF